MGYFTDMKRILLVIALLFTPSIAWAQCNGVFPANTLCGNLTGTAQPPAAFSSAGTIAGPASSTSSFIATWSNALGTQLGSFNSISTSQAITFTGVVTATSGATFTNTTSFNAVTNFTSQFQINGNRIQFPVGPDTVGGLGTNQTWTSANTFTALTSVAIVSLGSSISTAVPLSASIGGTGHTSLFVPTTQSFTSGTSATYTTPTNPGPIYILVEMCGGGGGGGAQATNNGTAGTSTTFATWVAGPGQGGSNGGSNVAGGAGGTGGINGPGTQIIRQPGGAGGGVAGSPPGMGGISFLGGYGPVTQSGGAAGKAPQANSCGGGSAGGTQGTAGGAGGGAGEYVRFQIIAPASVYIYTIGGQGVGGAAGTQAGGLGTSGFILVREFYQ